MTLFKPTQSDFDYIQQYYQTTPTKDIASILGCSVSFVKKWGRQLTGSKKRFTYTLNEQYFQQITTPEQAYWLGFLMADGCIYDRNKGNSQKWLVLSLQHRDVSLLYKMKLAFNSNHPIKTTYKKDVSQLSYNNIVFVSDTLCDDLCLRGVKPNKSGREDIHAAIRGFNEDLLVGFLYGLFDADGCIVNSDLDTSCYMSYSGSVATLNVVSDIWKQLGVGYNVNISIDKRSQTYQYGTLSYKKHTDMITMIQKFTQDVEFDYKVVGLERKLKLMREYLRRFS